MRAFMQEVLPGLSKARRALAGELITATLGAVGKHFSESPRTSAEIKAYAEAMADMFLRLPRRSRAGLRQGPGAAGDREGRNHSYMTHDPCICLTKIGICINMIAYD